MLLQTRGGDKPVGESSDHKMAFLSSDEHSACLSSNVPLVQYRYFESTDTLCIHLGKVTSSLFVDTWDVHPGLLVDFDAQAQPVALNVLSASLVAPVHFYNSGEAIDGKPPLQLGQIYDPYSKALTLCFCAPAADHKDVETGHAAIRVIEDKDGKWVGLRVKDVVVP